MVTSASFPNRSRRSNSWRPDFLGPIESVWEYEVEIYWENAKLVFMASLWWCLELSDLQNFGMVHLKFMFQWIYCSTYMNLGYVEPKWAEICVQWRSWEFVWYPTAVEQEGSPCCHVVTCLGPWKNEIEQVRNGFHLTYWLLPCIYHADMTEHL